jgi:hypothetical protein
MTITKNGVCYNLTLSPFIFQTGDIKLVFSSKTHKDKFKDKQEEHRDILRDKLTKKFGVTVDINLLADIVLYADIETRGFLIFDKEGNALCKNDIILNGGTVTRRNLNE